MVARDRYDRQLPVPPPRWRASFWPALLVGCLTLAAALAVGSVLRDREARALEMVTASAHAAVLNEVEYHMRDQLQALERLAANWERRGGLPRGEFEAEAGDLARDFSFLQAIEWADPGFHVRWVVPLAGNEAAQDLDLAFEGRRRTALTAARDGRVTTVSRPIHLVQGGLGFLAYVPLDLDGRFDGFVVGVFRATDLLSGLLRNVALGFGVRIADGGEFLYKREVPDAVWPGVRATRVLGSVRAWSIEISPGPNVVATYQTKLPLLVVVVGALLALGLGTTMQLARSERTRNLLLASEVKRRKDLEQKLSGIIEALPDHVWSAEISPDGFENTFHSPHIENITGYPPVDTFRDSLEAWYETVHEADIEMLRSANNELQTGQRESFDLEYRIVGAGGELRWVRERVRSTPTHAGRHLDGVISDITETKRAEAERLRLGNERMLLLERERMMREMHDGLGGQLVSTIAMLERNRWTRSEVSESLRRALDDMRIVIDSLDPTTTDLTTSLGKLRARLEPLLRRNGIGLRWQIDEVPGLDDYPPEQTLHFLRIIQEAVTNAMRHAKPSEVSIRASAARGEMLLIEIRDNGSGFLPDSVQGGRGIQHMMSRANALGAELRFERENPGTLVELRVALPRPQDRDFERGGTGS
jgi:PAS domain S-box-containing protein